MKRFTETTKWADAWYRKLTPRLKCLWQYLVDHCDAAGVINPDFELASFQIGEEVSQADLEQFSERVQITDSGKLCILKFIPFQYGELSDSCPAHKPIFKKITEHRMDRVGIGYRMAIHSLQERKQIGIGQEEEKTIGEFEGGDPYRDYLKTSPEFCVKWIEWKQHLSDKEVPAMSRMQELSILKRCAEIKAEPAIAAIQFTIEKGAKNIIWDWATQNGNGRGKPNAAQKPGEWDNAF